MHHIHTQNYIYIFRKCTRTLLVHNYLQHFPMSYISLLFLSLQLEWNTKFENLVVILCWIINMFENQIKKDHILDIDTKCVKSDC